MSVINYFRNPAIAPVKLINAIERIDNINQENFFDFYNDIKSQKIKEKYLKTNFINQEIDKMDDESKYAYLLLITVMWGIHITKHDETHKLEGMQSISTSVLRNKFCKARMKCDGICAHCFAEKLTKYYTDLEKCLWRNTDIFCNIDLPVSFIREMKLTEKQEKLIKKTEIVTYDFRFESFGDSQCLIECHNKIKIAEENPQLNFGLWSKNYALWARAFELFGKPNNLVFVVSSLKINERLVLPDYIAKWVDHIFTVWTPEEYIRRGFANGPTACAGIRCHKCHKCYRTDTSYYIDEMLR